MQLSTAVTIRWPMFGAKHARPTGEASLHINISSGDTSVQFSSSNDSSEIYLYPCYLKYPSPILPV